LLQFFESVHSCPFHVGHASIFRVLMTILQRVCCRPVG
jgi:hypothetical protein